MKVIGKIDADMYICAVSHTEIEKFLNLYYNKLERLKTGDEVDLGKGYNFRQETERALKTTREFIESNKEVIEAIISGISIMAKDAGAIE